MKIRFLSILLLLCFFSCTKSMAQKPNVIFIMCDDLNDYEGVFGGHPQAKTPNIDRLAASGVQFLNAQSNVPVCQPSRNCLFTGVYPHDSKDFGWTEHAKQPVLKYNKTIPELFGENGYYTLASGKLLHGVSTSVTGVWNEWGVKVKNNYGPFPYSGSELMAHPDVPSPYREIGAIDGSFGRLSVQPEHGWVNGRDNSVFNYESEENRDLMQDEKHAVWAVQKMSELEANATKQPFFMGLGFVNPHTPLLAPDKYFDMFPINEIVLDEWLENDEEDTHYIANFGDDKKGSRYYNKLLESYSGDRELALKHFLQAYLACVAFVDTQIGVVLDALENSSLNENTIVILTSDHGWQMGEKSYMFKNSPWEESARVPLIIKTPQSITGAKVEHPVSLVDIYPTLIDLCGLQGDNKKSPLGGDLGGYSLKPFLTDPDFADWQGPEGALTLVGNFGNSAPVHKQNFSYRTKDWRYILYSNGSEELYDHVNDPYEWYNLINLPEYALINEQLKQQVLDILPTKSTILFYDDFETYSLGYNLKANGGYQIWGADGNGTFVPTNDKSGSGVYDGTQFGVTHSGWGACLRTYSLNEGSTYRFSVATKAESETAGARKRSITISSDNYTYSSIDVDNSVDDWVFNEISFTVQPGFEDVTINITGDGSAALGIDNYSLEVFPHPILKLADDGLIREGYEDGEVISVRLENDVFVEQLDLKQWVVENLPVGVTLASITRISDTRAMVQLQGTASNSYDGNDITNIRVTLPSSQLTYSENSVSASKGVVFRAGLLTSVETISSDLLRLYPNPCDGKFIVESNEFIEGILNVYSISGQKVFSQNIRTSTTQVVLPNKLRGIYIVRMESGKQTLSQKLIVR